MNDECTQTQSGAGLTTSQQIACFFLNGMTNLCFWIPAIQLYKRGLFVECYYFLLMSILSFLYHTSDAFAVSFFGINTCELNEIDDIFAVGLLVLSFQTLLNHVKDSAFALTIHTREVNIFNIWFNVCLSLFWNQSASLSYSSLIWPSFFGVLCTLVSLGSRRIFWDQILAVALQLRRLVLLLVFTVVGVAFFVLSQDRGSDFLRWKHGLWHISIAVAMVILVGMCRYDNDYVSSSRNQPFSQGFGPFGGYGPITSGVQPGQDQSQAYVPFI